jgi:hypothetical protein
MEHNSYIPGGHIWEKGILTASFLTPSRTGAGLASKSAGNAFAMSWGFTTLGPNSLHPDTTLYAGCRSFRNSHNIQVQLIISHS